MPNIQSLPKLYLLTKIEGFFTLSSFLLNFLVRNAEKSGASWMFQNILLSNAFNQVKWECRLLFPPVSTDVFYNIYIYIYNIHLFSSWCWVCGEAVGEEAVEIGKAVPEEVLLRVGGPWEDGRVGTGEDAGEDEAEDVGELPADLTGSKGEWLWNPSAFLKIVCRKVKCPCSFLCLCSAVGSF